MIKVLDLYFKEIVINMELPKRNKTCFIFVSEDSYVFTSIYELYKYFIKNYPTLYRINPKSSQGYSWNATEINRNK